LAKAQFLSATEPADTAARTARPNQAVEAALGEVIEPLPNRITEDAAE